MSSKERESPLVKKSVSLAAEKFLLNYILYAVLAGIIVCFACLNGNFLTVNNILNNFDKYAYLLVCACGTTIVLCGGGFDLSTGGVLAALTVLGGEIMVNTRSIGLGIVVFAVMVYVLHHTGYGRKVFAVGGNRKASYITGINDKMVSVSIYALNGLLIGVGAAMAMAKSSVARATTGTSLQMYCTAVAVIGGTSLKGGQGNLYGTLLGVAIYSLIISGLNAVGVDAFWQEIMTGGIIIFAAMIDSYKTRSNA